MARFGKEAVAQNLSLYQIGTVRFWPGATVFWQQNIDGRFRTGKITLYDRETGHRVKNPFSRISWVHCFPMFHDFHLRQGLFGEHLLKGTSSPIGIVESEKTAIIASLFFPKVIFLATGGLNNLQSEKLRCLASHRIFLFPDLGAEEKWSNKANVVSELRNATVSKWLSRNSTDTEKKEGFDLGDFLLRQPIVRRLRIEDFL